MRRCTHLVPITIFCSALLLFGCSKKSEAPRTQSTPAQGTPSTAGTAESSELPKAVSAHKAFLQDFFKIGGLRNVEFYQRRVDFADKSRSDISALLSQTKDPQAQQFLTRFTDLLQQYAEAGRKVIYMDGQIRDNAKSIEEARVNLPHQVDSSTAKMGVDTLEKTQSNLHSDQANNVSALNQLERELSNLK